MLKADLANNDSDGVYSPRVYITTIHSDPAFSFIFSRSLFLPFFIFLCELYIYKVIRKGCVTLGRAVKVFMTANPPTREDITVIAAMRGPNIALLTRFMTLFIASSKTLINNVSHTNSWVVKSFLYWNFCFTTTSTITISSKYSLAMIINYADDGLRPKLTLTNTVLLYPVN